MNQHGCLYEHCVCVSVWSFYISIYAAAAHAIRQFICCFLRRWERRAILMSIVCFGHHHRFGLPDLSEPTLQPNPFAKHNRAGWKWSRLATGPLPLGCGAVPAVCYSVALETLLKKGFSEPTCTCLSLLGDRVQSAGLWRH